MTMAKDIATNTTLLTYLTPCNFMYVIFFYFQKF